MDAVNLTLHERLYTMKLHEEGKFILHTEGGESDTLIHVLSVPGGWVYTIKTVLRGMALVNSVFIPIPEGGYIKPD
jgi:hypothetical protein